LFIYLLSYFKHWSTDKDLILAGTEIWHGPLRILQNHSGKYVHSTHRPVSLSQGWRTCLRARAQIVYTLRRNPFA
jgi:hypothetical protein